MGYLEENNIVFLQKNIEEKISPQILRLKRNPIIIRRLLEQTSERFHLSMRDLDKLDELLSQSKELFEKNISSENLR
tara:strand:+ start:151 stop:381 length:231 start_codon:yes stop_codon:yes gene_type:complete